VTRSPGKDLHRLDTRKAQRIIRALHTLCDDPSLTIRMLKGDPGYTFRIGFYDRAILSVHDTVLIIHLIEVGDRNQDIPGFLIEMYVRVREYSVHIDQKISSTTRFSIDASYTRCF
jgi:mRNA-degrading endonuclease RelE of RelBE toxin-antitoxin system